MCVTGAAANATGFHAQFSRDINGQLTEFVYHKFANKWFLLITQYGKAANLYSIEFDDKRSEGIMQAPIHHPQLHMSVPITVKCNFGADTEEVRAGIQFLINESKLNRCPTEIVVSLGLKDINGKNLREVAKVLDEIIK